MPSEMVEREVDCPRCHETCGWCGDYRHYHGTIKLPGSNQYCAIRAMHPDPCCTLCAGTMRVVASTQYRPITAAIGEGSET